ncbi:MAG: glycosyltransferase [Alphaproteobacteria bacterium]|nr:glycosyltransferase [Alphaproteobacteria bacterium]
MTQDHKKSICYLICVFNDNEGLLRTLKSIYQDDPLTDILIIDDGSTPCVSELPERQGFEHKLIRLPENKGLIAALNIGIEHIIGQRYTYVARLDAGDTVNKGRLSAQKEYLELHPDVGMVGTQLRAFDKESGDTLFHFNNPVGAKNVARTLKMKNCLAHPSVMIRMSVFKELGGYDPEFIYAEDYEMWRRIASKYGVDNLPEVYVNKEISKTQMTAVNRRASSLTKMRAQFKYFKLFDLWCYVGVVRTLISLILPRKILLFVRSKLSGAS